MSKKRELPWKDDPVPTNFKWLGKLSPEDEKWIVDWDNAMARFYLSEAGKEPCA